MHVQAQVSAVKPVRPQMLRLEMIFSSRARWKFFCHCLWDFAWIFTGASGCQPHDDDHRWVLLLTLLGFHPQSCTSSTSWARWSWAVYTSRLICIIIIINTQFFSTICPFDKNNPWYRISSQSFAYLIKAFHYFFCVTYHNHYYF